MSNQAIEMPRSKAEYVAQRLLDRIITENPAVGTLLGTEAELLAQFDVSRPTFRESLRILEMQGVLELRPGPRGGVVVSRPGTDILAQGISVYLQLHSVPKQSVQRTKSVMKLALATEAASFGSEADFDLLDDSVTRMTQAVTTEALGREIDSFYTLLAQAGHNQVTEIFWATLSRLDDGAGLPAQDIAETDPRARLVRLHVEIATACRARDSRLAQARIEAANTLIENPEG